MGGSPTAEDRHGIRRLVTYGQSSGGGQTIRRIESAFPLHFAMVQASLCLPTPHPLTLTHACSRFAHLHCGPNLEKGGRVGCGARAQLQLFYKRLHAEEAAVERI